MNAIANPQPVDQLPASSADNAFNLAYRRAKALSAASLVPESYRNNIPNTMIAMEMADRIGAGVMQVMQNLHIIQGRPSLSSSFLIATVNACGRFTPLRFEVVGGDDPSKDSYRVRAFARDKASDEVCLGAWITWPMVKAEKWSTKPGSKWLTMPEQMFMYRAAAFWARVYAPEVSQGIHTAEEVTDVLGGLPTAVHVHGPTTTSNLRQLESELRGDAPPPAEHCDDIPAGAAMTVDEVKAAIEAAADVDALDEAYDMQSLVNGITTEQRQEITGAYQLRRDTLDLA